MKRIDPGRAPGRAEIEAVVEAATWAPNHHMTEPWRFVVVTGAGRARLGDALAAAAAASPQAARASPEVVERERRKPLEAPFIVALIGSPRRAERIVPQEELVAAGAALQNMLLAAHSLGLASFVRTGEGAYSEEVRALFGMGEGETMVAMVYLGYAAGPVPPGRRTAAAQKTAWMES